MTDIAVVVLDTMRKDVFDEYFDWLPGKKYNNCYSTSHRTPPAHASLFCGKYPSELGVYKDSETLNCQDATLAERLAESGYETRAFSANTYVTEYFEFDRGFQEFRTPWQLSGLSDNVFDYQNFVGASNFPVPLSYVHAVLETLRSDAETLESLKYGAKLFLSSHGILGHGDDGVTEAIEFVKDSAEAEDEFLFCNLMEVHEPYEPPQKYRTANLSGFPTSIEVSMQDLDVDPAIAEQAYRDCARYLSDKYREIFDELKESFDYVITCADHGELFGKDGLWGHFYGVYPELTNVPLVISGPEVSDSTTNDEVSLLDVHKTVLDLAGVDAPSSGRNLLEDLEPKSYITECHGIAKKRIDNLGEESDVADRLEPMERSLWGIASPNGYYGYQTLDGFKERGKSIHSDPEAEMDAIIESLAVNESDLSEMSESVERHLEDLGYMV
jgi:arylsulfatase A-like enzyme